MEIERKLGVVREDHEGLGNSGMEWPEESRNKYLGSHKI